tara:strand:+ start:14526 stop:14789 length:264 start_codon:yes stop_codon:yes gene_type:complete
MGQALPFSILPPPSRGLPIDRLERIEDLLDAILLTLAVAAAESTDADSPPGWDRVLQLAAHYTDTPAGELALRRAMNRARNGGFYEP